MINEQDNCTLSTPLHVAITNKNKAFVKAVMDLPDVRYDLADSSGNTVLHLATMNKDAETLKVRNRCSKPCDSYCRNPSEPFKIRVHRGRRTSFVCIWGV